MCRKYLKLTEKILREEHRMLYAAEIADIMGSKYGEDTIKLKHNGTINDVLEVYTEGRVRHKKHKSAEVRFYQDENTRKYGLIEWRNELPNHTKCDNEGNIKYNKPQPRQSNEECIANVKRYNRNTKLAKDCKELYNYVCEFDFNYKHFFNGEYVESHHLIPKAAWERFNYSLEVIENMCCISVSMHKILHNPKDPRFKKLLKFLYDKHIEGLKRVGLHISFKNLVELYEKIF